MTQDDTLSLKLANILWQEGDVPLAKDFDDIYFSRKNGLEETNYVFLEQNHLEPRWRQLDADQASQFTIAETGFGTGLNFLAAWQLFLQQAPATAQLHYISAEKYPLKRTDLARALAAWPSLAPLSEQLLAHYPHPTPGLHRIELAQGRVTLHLLLGDAADSLLSLANTHRPELPLAQHWQVDAWFLDGFAPAKNPQMWNDRLYQAMALLSAPGTTLATFTAVGEVRRSLERHGFKMQKVPGFGSKREMLCGVFQQLPSYQSPARRASKAVQAPWDFYSPPTTPPSSIAVIGGGLAGCHTAHALAKRGFKVSLYDEAAKLASAASGNSQGVLFTKLSANTGQLSQFALSSYLYALRHYRRLLPELTADQHYQFCGVLQLAHSKKLAAQFEPLQKAYAALPELVQFVDAEQASQLAGIELSQPGWFFPEAGWLSPPEICRKLVEHHNIQCHLGQPIANLQHTGSHWQLQNRQQQCIATVDVVVIANSHAAQLFSQTAELPLRAIRGQVTEVAANMESASLKTVLCHEGYLTPQAVSEQSTPPYQPLHQLGATFDVDNHDTCLRDADHQRNLSSLEQVLPGLFNKESQILGGRAALRCTSPDYLPLVGPVANRQAFMQDYAELRRNAYHPIDQPGSYHPQLYINVGHGSRGLTSTPLSAELIAAHINREPPALPRELQRALHPARFYIRDLIRNRI